MWFCGVKRAMALTDSEYVSKIHALLADVPSYTKFACPLKEHDMTKVNRFPHLLSAVPEGTRCYLIMMKLAGTYVTILYDRGRKATNPILVLPMRLHEEVYRSEPVFTCVFNRLTRTLIVDDMVSMNGTALANQYANDRIMAVHDMLHNMYRPDVHLLPLKIEVRRYYAYSQLDECLDLCKRLQYPSVGVGIKPLELTRREMIAPFRREHSHRAPVQRLQAGTYAVAKGEAPDMYTVSTGTGAHPLVVKTLKDSVRLAKRFSGQSTHTLQLDLQVCDGKFVLGCS